MGAQALWTRLGLGILVGAPGTRGLGLFLSVCCLRYPLATLSTVF